MGAINGILMGVYAVITLFQICRNSNSSKLSCKNDVDQIKNEGARVFTRFLPL